MADAKPKPASGGSAKPPPRPAIATWAFTDIPRWAATQCLPWESAHHAFHYTKMAAGAQIDMGIDEWNNMLLLEELKKHPLILSFVGIPAGLWRRPPAAPDQHECDTNYRCHVSKLVQNTEGVTCRCHMQGNYFITVGYSHYQDKSMGTYGWVMFGTGCKSVSQKIEAVVTMLNLMGFEAPAEIAAPAPGGTPIPIALLNGAQVRVPPSAQVHYQIQPNRVHEYWKPSLPSSEIPRETPREVRDGLCGHRQLQAGKTGQCSVCGLCPPGYVPEDHVVTEDWTQTETERGGQGAARPGYPKAEAASGGAWPEEPASGGPGPEQDAAAQAAAEETSGVHEPPGQPKWTEEEMRVGVCVWVVWVGGWMCGCAGGWASAWVSG